MSVVITGPHPLQPGILAVSMIVHHIHHHSDPLTVQRLNHFLALPDPHRPVCCVRSVGALRHIVVQGIISPVELAVFPRFIDGCIVKKRHKLHMGHSQPYKMPHAGRKLLPLPHCEGLVLSPVLPRHAALRVIRKVLDMQLVDDILLFLVRSPIRLKARGIRQPQIRHHAPRPVAAAGHGIRVRRPHILPLVPNQIIIIHPMEVLRKFQLPDSTVLPLQLPFQKGLRRAVPVKAQRHLFRKRTPDLEGSPLLAALRSQIPAVVSKLFVEHFTGEKR